MTFQIDFPSWFFTTNLSSEAKELIVGLLQPDPQKRLTIRQAVCSRWLSNQNGLVEEVCFTQSHYSDTKRSNSGERKIESGFARTLSEKRASDEESDEEVVKRVEHKASNISDLVAGITISRAKSDDTLVHSQFVCLQCNESCKFFSSIWLS